MNNLRKYLKSVASLYGFRSSFKNTLKYGVAGYVNSDKKVFVHNKLDTATTISTFFHELSHLICMEHNLFMSYHKSKLNLTYKQKIALKKTAYNAENYVDKKAEELAKFYFPNLKYVRSYRTKQDKKWLNDFMKEDWGL